MSALSALFILGFPLVFLIHEAEEMIIQRRWIKNNHNRVIAKFPRAQRIMNHLTELNNVAFGIAVAEEFLIVLMTTLLLLSLLGNSVMMWIWIGVFGAFTVHTLIHIAQAVALRSYIPGLISSILLMPYCAMMMHSIWLAYPLWGIIIAIGIGSILSAGNLLMAHKLGLFVSKTLKHANYCLL
ncbi:MAG: HXXEE domain-containing protein [Muribaculaceae bacterium]|nr:HXXEE domain-containing protein [Muribaculaceae bacterium]